MSQDLHNIDTLDVSPFRHFITTIGNLPTSFTDSMSYYEMLAWFCDYLKNTVIPAINNNAQAVEELQALYVELKSYVDNYFDNLDVQQQIDHKLDEMTVDGTLRSIINDDLFQEINNKILQNTVDIAANTEAIEEKISEDQPNSVTMNMLTQEVREALTGGSTAVVGEDSVDAVNIKDGAVTIFKEDDYLQNSKFIEYGDEVNLGVKSNGIATEDGDTHKVTILNPTATNLGWYKVALTKGKYYIFCGYDYFSGRALIIADSSDNVLWVSSTSTSSNVFTPITKIFRANTTGLYAYIDVFNNMNDHNMLHYNCPDLREMDKLYNKFKVLEPRKIRTIEDAYTSASQDWSTNMPDGISVPYISAYSGVNIDVYEMVKGAKYSISAYSWSSVNAITIVDLNQNVLYKAHSSSSGSTYVHDTYEFTATKDGYITLCKYDSHPEYDPTIEIIDQIPDTSEKLSFSRWYALGDSLTEKNSKASKNYVDYIKEELGIDTVNLGHSGAGYMHTYNDKNFRTEVQEIVGYNYNTDVITVMGSINDFNHLGADYGELGDTGTDTLYGCMYTFFNSLQTRFTGTRLGVISLPTTTDNLSTFKTNSAKYMKALKETAELFSVPVLDMTLDCNLKPFNETFRNEFYNADGTGGSGVDAVHPNSKGHWIIHNKIKEFIKTL